MATISGLMAAAALAEVGQPPTADDRIVALGDSITDGNTYPQIVMQALREAGRPVPTIVCSGVASDTAALMAARLDRTVLEFKPTLVTFCAGTNDACRGVTPEQYEASLREVCGKVKASGARMVLLTPCTIEPKDGATAKDTEAANANNARASTFEPVIRKIAAEYGWPVAENNRLMRQAREKGEKIMAGDGIHPDYHGQSLMARSILDALGCADVALPKAFAPKLFPGVIAEWRMRLAPLGEDKKPVRLTAETVAALTPDASWVTYRLPDAEPTPPVTPEADWLEQERRNGFGLQVEKQVGKGLVQAVASLDEAAPRQAFVNIGIGVNTLWLNGKRLHAQEARWTGYHAGKERFAVDLVKGRNQLAIEIEGAQFFLSVTDKLVWEEEVR